MVAGLGFGGFGFRLSFGGFTASLPGFTRRLGGFESQDPGFRLNGSRARYVSVIGWKVQLAYT